SPARRRTLLQLGIWLVVAAVVTVASLRAVRDQLLAQVPAGTYRDGTAAAVTLVTGTLRERGEQVIWLGAGLAVVAYLVGPRRLPVRLRRYTVAGYRTVARRTGRGLSVFAAVGSGWMAWLLCVWRV